MLPPSPELLLEALADALQTLAFISPEPAAGDLPTPEASECLSLKWSAAGAAGELQLAAPRPLGELLAANILALDAGTPDVARHAVDALRELCNITTGALLARMNPAPEDQLLMGLPDARALPDPDAWRQFVAQPHTTVVMAEGYPLAVRVEDRRP